MNKDVMTPLEKTLMSGYITQGSRVSEFEKELSEYLEIPYLLTLNSATSGLTLALRLLGVNRDEDVVLTPALTCFATTASILSYGVSIRWIDTDPNTGNVSIPDIKSKLTEKTKVIYVVHWGGTPVDLDELDQVLEDHKQIYGFKPSVVEDCAHAFGAKYNNKSLGNHGNICVYSTQAIKQLTTGDGGIITLPTKEMYDRCKLLRWYGIDRDNRSYSKKDFRLENDIVEWGYKFHMNDISATIGLSNLKVIEDEVLKKNKGNAKFLKNSIKNEAIQLLTTPEKSESADWLFTIKILNGRKQEFIDYMLSKQIMVSQVHNRNDVNTCVESFQSPLPNLDVLEKQIVCIPVGWWLTEENREYIVKCVNEF
tara:strand:- start:2874 stop:3977 length:1104 start_codon:yes stop_codon:yes gene_type:complete